MVSALYRKEPEQIVIYSRDGSKGYIQQLGSSKPHKDNFPYALQEFINSHMDLPDFDEIIGKGKNTALSADKAK